MHVWLKKHGSLSHVVFLMLSLLGLAYPGLFSEKLRAWAMFFAVNFDWLTMLVCTGFLVFCAYLAVSRYGDIHLGSPGEEPEYNTISWFSMLFAAGMGTGLVFHAAAEPLFHLSAPPPSLLGAHMTQAQAARQAMTITYLHWGLHAWAIYAIAALAVAYFSFRQGRPMLASAPLQAKYGWGNRHGMVELVNMIAVLAAVFGLVASIGTGIHQMQAGLEGLGLVNDDSPEVMLLILGLMGLCYIGSSLSGLGKGVRWLSNLNMLMCISLMMFVLITGPTHFILQSFVASLGDYLSRLVSLGMNVRPYANGTEWAQNWTVTYFLWWVAWAPFVAIFIARISRGRTIRQFLCGVILVPTLFSTLWFAIFGGTALHKDLFAGGTLAEVTQADFASAIFELLGSLPFSDVTNLVAIFLVFTFLVTSADSGAYVLGMFSSGGNPRPPRIQRLFWGLIVAGITAVTLISGEGLLFLRNASQAGAMPYMLIMVFQCVALWAFLKRDRIQ